MILLAGFEPFGGERINPSWEAVRQLDGAVVAGHTVEALCLPVVFGAAAERLLPVVAARRPDLLVLCGEAGGRSAISVERVAINVRDARMPDNAGRRPIDEPVIANGPAAYFSSLPVKAAIAAVRALGLPAEVSNSAGTYVCNDCFYAALHAAGERLDLRVGFIHVPYAPSQVVLRPGVASMATESVVAALHAILEAGLTDTPAAR